MKNLLTAVYSYQGNRDSSKLEVKLNGSMKDKATIIGGFGYMMAFAVMWVTSMYQMWIMPRNGKIYDSNEWFK